MTCEEFSNEFDVLYNNIASNQAPGINEYEKSVFLTKAQDEIIKSYFNPRTNKTQEGYDDNPRRQIDFSMITKSVPYKTVMYIIDNNVSTLSDEPEIDAVEEGESDPNKAPKLDKIPIINYDDIDKKLVSSKKDIITVSSESEIPSEISLEDAKMYTVEEGSLLTRKLTGYLVSEFRDPNFDERSNTKAVEIEDDILMLINEYIIVKRGNNYKQVRLTVVPINYNEYSRLMSKAYKRPLKWQAWRLIDNSNNNKNYSELIVGVNDTIVQYSIRYVRRPRPIILEPLIEEGLSINGVDTPPEDNNPCELDPILHPEIVQRAVELAKAAYVGDLNSQIALGQSSETEKGIVTQSR